MADLREKRVELILQQLEELPTLPAVALRVLEVTGDDTSSVADIVKVISSDPALTSRILQLTRRADLGVRGEVASIERAVLMLGFAAVRNAVLAVSVVQTFSGAREPHDGRSRFDREAFWTHCVSVASCAELLAEEMASARGGPPSGASHGEVSPPDAFICGLLHDLGKIALDAVLPKSFSRVVEAADLLRGNIADLERTVVGLDHMVVGKRLAERWDLPHTIRDAAWLHTQPPQALPGNLKSPRLVNLITLADALVREQHLGYSGNYTYPVARETLLQAVGLTAQQVTAALSRLVERIEPRAKALGLGRASSDELYQSALAQANRELGRVSTQLAAKNRKLSARTRFFDAMGQFHGGLRPDATPQAVLQAVARTAVGVLAVETVAVFSLTPGQDFAETVILNERVGVVESALVDLPGMSMVTGEASVASGPWPTEEVQMLSDAQVPGVLPDEPPVPTDEAPPAGENDLPPIDAVHESHEAPGSPESGAVPAMRSGGIGDGPVLPAGEGIEWLTSAISPRLPHDKRFWICLEADGALIGGLVWGAPAGEAERLSPQAMELVALAGGWGLALRAAQIREEARTLAEQLADANRRLYEAQSEILRSRALMAIGEMAAGAAHEMNNPLAVISGRSQLLASQLTDPRQKAAAQLVFEQSHRLSAIITEMMAFAKPDPPRPSETGLPLLIEAALGRAKAQNNPADRDFVVAIAGPPAAGPATAGAAAAGVQANAGAGVEVVAHRALSPLPHVTVDPAQVTAALTEVLANAIQATEQGLPGGVKPGGRGRITLQAGFDPYSRKVVVSVEDNGCGMDERTLKRAFDPFFSNKPAGRRRGLGLAKALRWVEANGGSIRLESRPGEGARVVILLPATAGQDLASGAEPRRAAQSG